MEETSSQLALKILVLVLRWSYYWSCLCGSLSWICFLFSACLWCLHF